MPAFAATAEGWALETPPLATRKPQARLGNTLAAAAQHNGTPHRTAIHTTQAAQGSGATLSFLLTLML